MNVLTLPKSAMLTSHLFWQGYVFCVFERIVTRSKQ